MYFCKKILLLPNDKSLFWGSKQVTEKSTENVKRTNCFVSDVKDFFQCSVFIHNPSRAGMFSSLLRNIGASLNFKIELVSLHISPGHKGTVKCTEMLCAIFREPLFEIEF
jgi:hypothetical protein